ncbi:MAG: FtsX-like permease family protein [Planctomycetota bacterium]
MRPAWRLATNSLWARRSRAGLLLAAVALSAALVTLIAAGMGTLNQSIALRLQATVGEAQIAVTPTGLGQTLDRGLLEQVRAFDFVTRANGALQTSVSMQATRPIYQPRADGSWSLKDEALRATVLVTGLEAEAKQYELLAGRKPTGANEIVLDALAAERLSWRWASEAEKKFGFGFSDTDTDALFSKAPKNDALAPSLDNEDAARAINDAQRVRVGDRLRVRRLLGSGPELLVVGLARQPPLGGRPQGYMTLEGAAALANQPGRLSQIDVVLPDEQDANAAAETIRASLGGVESGVLVKTTERVTSGLDRNLRSSQLGFALVSTLAFLSASFIIMTGLTTDVAQRQRELAVLRCVGASRPQLAQAQVFVGLLLGGLGAMIGVPLGIGVAWALISSFPDQTPSGLVIPWWGLTLSAGGAVLAGVLGAAWPAWIVSKTSPLEGLSVRARPARASRMALLTGFGLLGLAIQLSVVMLPESGTTVFWLYVFVGMPSLFIGYFLLGVAAVMLVTLVFSPLIGRVLALPSRMLPRQVRSTPYRHGFTAGALMTGLAIMVALWTEGGALMRDYLGKIQFPDAFVSSLFLTEDAQATLDAMDFVDRTCAITIEPIEVDAFGIRQLQQYRTSFIAFEPREFFDITQIEWVEGDRDRAIERLEAGGAVIVAREFQVAQGLGVGDTLSARKNERVFDFEIVGVVTSPGIELVSKFFNIGEEFNQQAMHAVFGSRDDLKNRLGSDQIHLIQIDLADDADDAEAVAIIRRELFDYGIMDAGSGRLIRDEILGFMRTWLLAITTVAVVAMVIASFGVANLIAAGIEVRRFEFGVLRALGAQRGLLARLVLGETLIIALAACTLGTAMGLQGVLAGQRLYQALFGIEYTIRPPIDAIAIGWGFVITLSLLAAGPSAWRLMQRQTRALLASKT